MKVRTKTSHFTKLRKGLLILFMIALSLLAIFALGGCSTATETADSPETEAAPKGIPAERIPGIPAERISDDLSATDSSSIKPKSSHEAASTGGTLLVRFLDVGQGDAALISCDGHHMLIDGGSPSASSQLYSTLSRLGINELEVVIATHPDADHCGGLAGALNYAKCKTFYCTVSSYDTRAFNNILDHLTVPIVIPSYGDSFRLGDAEITFVNPMSAEEPRDNNGSLACVLAYGQTKFLFTGDAETESEAAMINGRYDLAVDVLKVGHHGSSTSSSPTFLDTVSPSYAVISVGDNNYGHPDSVTLDKLTKRGIQILRTDELGTITFRSDGDNVQFESTAGYVQE